MTRGKDRASISKRGKTMRLIDADALKEELNSWAVDLTKSKFPHYVKDDADCIIDTAPTIDAVPVIRCRDCTYYCPFDDSRPYDCLRSGMLCVRKEDFCSCGKGRR